jgi:hypothetical protein
MSLDIKEAIVDMCEGIPREIVISLDTVRDITNVDDAIGMITSLKGNPTIKELCQALLKRESWKSITTILKKISEDPEEIRYAILGYQTAVLLKGDNKQAALIIEMFKDSFMYSKKAGLTLACYMSVM